MFDTPAPRVLTIESGASFVDTLAKTLLEIGGDSPLGLAEMRVLLPTRRACRSLAEAFIRLGGGKAMLLPRLTPLGDIDEDELAIAEAGTGGADLPPAIPGLRRQMLLTRAVMAMPEHAMQPEQSAALALELARLIDRLATEDCDTAKLRTLVPENFAEHWQEVLKFLEILITRWPEVLAGEGALDPAARRNALLRAEARRWFETPPGTPVIAAGSTGSIPATSELLSVVARLPQGAVVLPGLDGALDDDAWELLGPTHPQYGLKQLLGRLGIERADVRNLAPSEQKSGARTRVLAAALRPARAPEAAPPSNVDIAAASNRVSLIDTPGPSEEAAVIALIMRRTLNEPGKTCALITPDRDLARRVAANLARWHLSVDDSAGRPLAQTRAGAFLRLVADAAAERLAPVPLLALLKHPLAAGGMASADFRDLVRALEYERILRGPRPGPGVAGIRALLEDSPGHRRLRPLLDKLDQILGPLVARLQDGRTGFRDLLTAHIAAAESLAADADQPGAARLWSGDDGEASANFVAELADSLDVLGPLPGAAYPGLFQGLMAGRAVRPHYGTHPRLHIWGLLEARLQHADTVILGGLNEGTWPPAPETNPWMSRPMMAEVGLEPPERRIGLTAHDFQQAFSAPEVIMTRAGRVAGAPTVPSRWLLRLENLLARSGMPDALKPNEEDNWLGWVEALDAAPREPAPAPAPRPPLKARPKRLSVTQVETLIRDPYAIYARHILGLDVLEPLDADPGAADRGTIIHDALKDFVREFPGNLPSDAERRLIEIGRRTFGDHLSRPGVRAFWWPRFERIAAWFVDWHRSRITEGWEVLFAEDFGGISIDAVEGGFEIFAKPDRIDYRPGIGLAIIDYKTGQTPSAPQVKSGLSPQLPLEAVIARAGNFEGVPAEDATQLIYVRLSGGRVPGEAIALKLEIPELVDDTMTGVRRLVTAFADPKKPYLSRPRPQFENRFGDYDHLARVAERGGADGGDE